MRFLDVSLSALGLLILAPLFAVIALAVRVTTPGPVFYRARRVGRDGCLFDVYKFRSMVADASTNGPRVTAAGDARVTAIGRILRRTKLDELPQLLNTLKGDMSLVGPRPEDPEYVKTYSSEQRRVLSVRPGITSPATVLHRREEEMLTGPNWEERYRKEILPAKLQIELDYLSRRTLSSDLVVLVQTASPIFGKPRASETSRRTPCRN